MKKWLLALLLLCLMLPVTALADQATQNIPVYQVEPTNGFVYVEGVLLAGTEYTVTGITTPDAGTALADYFITSAPIVWGKFVTADGMRTGLIVMNPNVILWQRTYTEMEAAVAEARYRAYGNAYVFTPTNGQGNYYYVQTALVLSQRLTLREQPKTSAKGLKTLSYGAIVTCTGMREPGWVEAIVDDKIGWVRDEFLLFDPQYITFDSETPVLAWPSPNAPWVGLLDAGTTAPVMGVYNGYTVISLRGASGFVK